MTEAKLERRFCAASKDLARLYAAYYFVELTMALTEPVDPQPELFDLLRTAIEGVDEGEPIEPWILRFEMRQLTIVGQSPALDHCVACGKSVARGTERWISTSAGGLICQSCRPGKRSVVTVSAEAVDTLRRFGESTEDWRRGIPPSAVGSIRGLMNQYIAHVLGYRPKLIPYLASLRN